MQEKGCFVRRIEFRNADRIYPCLNVDVPFRDIHMLHGLLERVGYDQRCTHGTIIVAYDLRGNIISALSFNGDSTGMQPAISPSVASHSKVWEKALEELSETFDTGNFPSFNESLEKKLKKSSRIAYENGSMLLADAELLFDNERLARAGSLSILAFEEFSKSFMLQSCLITKRWDRAIYLALRDHSKKHAVFYAALSIAPTLMRFKNSQFCYGNITPTSEIENVTKTFVDKRYLDKLKQSLQFSDVKKDGSSQQVSTNNQDISIGIYLAKLAWYYLCYAHEEIGIEYVKSIEEGVTIKYPCYMENIVFDKYIYATRSIHFGDSTICTVNVECDSFANAKCDDISRIINNALTPIISRAKDILEGRKSENFSREVRDFWIKNQEILDVRGQLQREIDKLGYRFSPYLAAITEATL